MKKIFAALLVVLSAMGVAFVASVGTPRWAGITVIVWQVMTAFALQWAMYVHSVTRRTERYFDLTGSLTYVVLTLAGLCAGGYRSGAGWLLGGLVILWALRLGIFLFRRIGRAGKDERFDEILPDPARLFLTWTLQGLWVSLTALAAWVGLQAAHGPVPLLSWIGVAVWLVGFSIEVVADRQKRSFRDRPEHRDDFIRTGLWAWSRHPNYFGEIVVWVGILLIAAPYLHGWQWAVAVSPIFVVVLLTRISGIPLLERKADARWGDRAEYQRYKNSTPLIIPRPPRR